MENLIRNPTITTLMRKFDKTFRLQYLKVLTTKDVTEEGLIPDIDTFYTIRKKTTNKLVNLHNPYNHLTHHFSIIDQDMVHTYMPEVSPDMAIRMVRTLALVLWHMMVICINLTTDCQFHTCYLKKYYLVLENVHFIDTQLAADYLGSHPNATNTRYWEHFNVVMHSGVCSLSNEKCQQNSSLFDNEALTNFTNAIFSKSDFALFDEYLGRSAVLSALTLCQSCSEVCSRTVFNTSRIKTYSFLFTYVASYAISTLLIITALVIFLVTPELRSNLNGKSTTCYLLTLTVSYVMLILDVISTFSRFVDTSCKYIGYAIWFSTLSSCFWLNVICLDIFLAFWRPDIIRTVGEGTRLKIYCAYSWGLPFIISVIVFVIDQFNLGFYSSCHFFYKVYHFEDVYIVGLWDIPAGLSLLGNVIIFVMTTLVLCRHARRSRILGLDGSSCPNRVPLNTTGIYLKLLSVVGINWMLQVYAWHNNTPDGNAKIQIIGNLQGAIVFIFLICRTSTVQAIKQGLNTNLTTSIKIPN